MIPKRANLDIRPSCKFCGGYHWRDVSGLLECQARLHGIILKQASTIGKMESGLKAAQQEIQKRVERETPRGLFMPLDRRKPLPPSYPDGEIAAWCPECGEPHHLVRPGKTQPNCDCDNDSRAPMD